MTLDDVLDAEEDDLDEDSEFSDEEDLDVEFEEINPDLDDDDDEETEDDDAPAGRNKGSSKGSEKNPGNDDDDDDDDDDVHPSDLEADLDEILRDRIAAGDGSDDEEDETGPTESAHVGEVAPRQEDEWTCTQCFLIVSSSQFGPRDDPRCPSGEDPCVSLERVRSR